MIDERDAPYRRPLPRLSPARKVDITGDGGVLKEVLKPGVGSLVPQPDDEVCLHYTRWLREAGVDVEFHRYLAHHAFANETAVGSGRIPATQYDPVWAQQAWDRALTFLGRTLWPRQG